MLGKLSIIGTVAAILMIPTAPCAQMGGAVNPGVHVGGAVSPGASVRGAGMHGGALGSGAPRGNKNALKHGRFTREAIAERAHIRELVRQARKLLLQVE